LDFSTITHIYADGGLIGQNEKTIGSRLGGTWAICAVDVSGERVYTHSGNILPAALGLPGVTNNHSELWALLAAVALAPAGWTGTFCSDSFNALGRVFLMDRLSNVPEFMVERLRTHQARLGIKCRGNKRDMEPTTFRYQLLQGHPTKEDLANGVGKKRGLPVSSHNVWCDEECCRQRELYLNRIGPSGVAALLAQSEQGAI
jgi:hypothetical protein